VEEETNVKQANADNLSEENNSSLASNILRRIFVCISLISKETNQNIILSQERKAVEIIFQNGFT